VNIDKTNIYFDMTSATILAHQGKRTVSIRNTGSSQRCTVLLGVTMDGQKLPPFIIFKGKPGSWIIWEFTIAAHGYPQGQFYTVQDNAWVDCHVFLQWVNSVWSPFSTGGDVGGNGDGSYLIMDEFSVHMKSEVSKAIQQLGTEIEFIPGGYTGALQVLDKGINKPFKQYVQQAYERWMIANQDNSKPHRADVARWIADSWNQITVETITNTWHSIGLHGWAGREEGAL
jgi:hypothetical protein